MRVLITGGTGHIGKSTAKLLREQGWDVRIFDLASVEDAPSADTSPAAENGSGEFVQGDILDFDALVKAMDGCDAVVHLAAIRAPYLAPNPTVFRVNVEGTFNVYQAAADAGIRRVVQASSINAFGCYYGTVDLDVRYLPIDEAHPTHTTDPYSFSKQVIESIGEYFWRREGISGTALRFPGVYPAGMPTGERFQNGVKASRAAIDDLLKLPEAEQRARIAEAKARTVALRQQRPFEYHPEGDTRPHPGPSGDRIFDLYMGDRFNFWVFIDERDAARSLAQSLTAEYVGAHALFITDRVNYLGYDSRTLARLFFPEVSDIRGDLAGTTSLVSIDRARALIGFEPEFSLGDLLPG